MIAGEHPTFEEAKDAFNLVALVHEGLVLLPNLDLSPFTVAILPLITQSKLKNCYFYMSIEILICCMSIVSILISELLQIEKYTEDLKRWEGKHHTDLLCELRLRHVFRFSPYIIIDRTNLHDDNLKYESGICRGRGYLEDGSVNYKNIGR